MNIKTKLLSLAKIVGVYAGYLLVGTLIMPLIKLFPALVNDSAISISGIIFGGIVAVITVGYHFLVLFIFGRKEKPKSGFGFEKKWFVHFSASVGFAAACMLVMWLLSVLFGGFNIRLNILNGESAALILMLFVRMLLTGFQEELIVRGTLAYVGKNGGKWFSAIIIGLLFSFTHGGTMNVLFYVNLLLFSIVASQLTWITGNLWPAIGFHFSWNFVMGGVLGVPISGLEASGFLISQAETSNIINGGILGLEGSVFCTLVLAVSIILLYRLETIRGRSIVKQNVISD